LIPARIPTTATAPSDLTDPETMVTVLIGISDRQVLQRSQGFPTQQQVAAAQRIGCCIEAYDMPYRELNKIKHYQWIVP
jgi:hypothetical protein